MSTKRLLASLALLLALTTLSHAACTGGPTIWASTPDQASVASCVGSADDGDTINITAGSATWTSGVSISGKGITLQGAGSGRIVGRSTSAVVVGTGSKTFTTQSGLGLSAGQVVRATVLYNGAWVEGTVTSYSGTALVLNATTASGSGTEEVWIISTACSTCITRQTSNIFSITEDTTHSVRISGIKFIGGTFTGNQSFITVSYAAGGKPVVISDCWMTAPNDMGGGNVNKSIIFSTRRGLVTRCTMDPGYSSAFPDFHVNIQGINVKWEGPTAGVTWATPSTMGTADTGGDSNIYIENNDFHAFPFQTFDFDDNTRAVVRYNTFNNAGFVAHGQDTGNYGPRHFEIYNNTFVYNSNGDARDFPMSNGWFYVRGGTGVWTDNQSDNIQSSWWGGNLSEIVLTIQHLRRTSGCPTCWTGGPLAPRQVGAGYVTGLGNTNASCEAANTGAGYQGDLEPFYFWNNTGTLVIDPLDYEPDECGNGQTVTNYLRLGTEYIVGTAKPGYTKYTYPHPLSTLATSAAPTVTITAPTSSPTHSTSTTPLTTLAGGATDDVGVTSVTWSCNANGTGAGTCGSGTATCATCGAAATSVAWSVASIALQAGSNVLTVTALDGESQTAQDTLTVTYTPAVSTVPTVFCCLAR